MATVMRVYQAPGFTGSFAGDTGAVVGRQWAAVVDLGATHGHSVTPALNVTNFLNSVPGLNAKTRHLVITHFHVDHGNSGGQERTALVGAAPDWLRRFPTSGNPNADALAQALAAQYTPQTTAIYDGSQQFLHGVAGSVARQNASDLLCALAPAVLAPPQQNAENKYSGGIYAETRNGNGDPLFGFLSLGDMDPATSAGAIQALEAQSIAAAPPILLVKLPHHSSADNWSAPLGQLIGRAVQQNAKVYVIASGHTLMVDAHGNDGLEKAVAAGAAAAFLLVQEDVQLDVGKALQGQWWTRQTATDHLRLLDRALVVVDDGGAVTLEGRVWQLQTFPHDTINREANRRTFDLGQANLLQGSLPPLA